MGDRDLFHVGVHSLIYLLLRKVMKASETAPL